MIMFGAGVLYNHNQTKNIEYNWHSSVVVDASVPPEEPYSEFTKIQFLAVTDVAQGQELFVDYGSTWLQDRDIATKNTDDPVQQCSTHGTDSADSTENEQCTNTNTPTNTILSLSELEQYGHCLSHVGVGESTIPSAGNGLFAKKAFSAGQTVTIAPVLTLPRTVVESTRSSSVLMNYCITVSPSSNSTEVTLFPLNNAVLINHQPANRANLRMEWFDWSAAPSAGSYYEHLGGNAVDLSEKLRQTPSELFAAPFAQFDIAYVALRDIAAGEELSCDYGEEWAASWEQYVADMRRWEETQHKPEGQPGRIEANVDGSSGASASEGGAVEMPTMRAFIQAPAELFPAHWLREASDL